MIDFLKCLFNPNQSVTYDFYMIFQQFDIYIETKRFSNWLLLQTLKF